MADNNNNDAGLERINDHSECDAKCLKTPSGCRRGNMPMVGQKQGALRPARTAKAVMPFMEDMTDVALAEMRKRLEEEQQAEDGDDCAMSPRTA